MPLALGLDWDQAEQYKCLEESSELTIAYLKSLHKNYQVSNQIVKTVLMDGSGSGYFQPKF